jgi:Macrocin-O-methyltransferase (TylF)/Glycosyl transferases group 1
VNTNSGKISLLQLHNFPPSAIENFYNRFPSLKTASYCQQIEALSRSGTDNAYLIAPHLSSLGINAQLVITNCEDTQLQWAYERAVRLKFPDYWPIEIALAQVEKLNPEVLLVTNPEEYDSKFIRMVTKRPEKIIAWIFKPFSKDMDLSSFDIVFASHPKLAELALKGGAKKVENLLPFFSPFLPELIISKSKQLDLLYIGAWENNPELYNYLISIVREHSRGQVPFSYRFMVDNFEKLPKDLAHYCEPFPNNWLSYYALISQARQVLHLPNFWQDSYSSSPLLFESTGLGSRLLTKKNQGATEFFEIEEVDFFEDSQQLMDIITRNLINSDKLDTRTKLGQKRCLQDHSVFARYIKILEHCKLPLPVTGLNGVKNGAKESESLTASKNFEVPKPSVSRRFAEEDAKFIVLVKLLQRYGSKVIPKVREELKQVSLLRSLEINQLIFLVEVGDEEKLKPFISNLLNSIVSISSDEVEIPEMDFGSELTSPPDERANIYSNKDDIHKTEENQENNTANSYNRTIENALLLSIIDKVEKEEFKSALELINIIKSTALPVRDVDLLRAKCILGLKTANYLNQAQEVLREEIRLFPDNKKAIELSKEVDNHVDSTIFISPDLDHNFFNIYKSIKFHTYNHPFSLYSLYHHAKIICERKIEGKIIECGAGAGGSVALIALVCKQFSQIDREVIGIDTFFGLPDLSNEDLNRNASSEENDINNLIWGIGTFNCPEKHCSDLISLLELRNCVKLIKGNLKEENFEIPSLDNIALLHIDCFSYSSTYAALERLAPLLTRDGSIAINEGPYATTGPRRAVKDYLAKNSDGYRIVAEEAGIVWLASATGFAWTNTRMEIRADYL